ncbi:deoxyguanosinetriphosphate triphosphohydrolase family protein [Mariniluteicoccus flavus]
MVPDDPIDLAERRVQRAMAESTMWQPLTAGAESEFRVDLERLRFAPSFARLAEVTQVVTPGATDGVVHNRLTHSIKVTALARAIAVGLRQLASPDELDRWGGLDHVVCQAAAVAHDLGHPPFGHLGERTLDRVARERFGLTDGFEGNAQTFRIITALEVHGPGDEGLNLTAAVRAGVLKYPWGRFHVPSPHPTTWDDRPRGAGSGPDGEGAAKFSAYVPDLEEMIMVRDAFGLAPGRQTLECAVMDLADDIAYSLHDLEDFHRSGVLQFSPISGEFRGWQEERGSLAAIPDRYLAGDLRLAGVGLERLRRNLESKDRWIYDDDAFADAVQTVGEEFVDEVLALPYDGSRAAERAISGFVGKWIDYFTSSIRLLDDPTPRSPLVTLQPVAWHQMQVLKFVHQFFVLHRPDLTMVQRGQSLVLQQLVETFDAWLSDRWDAARAPRRLLDLVALSQEAYAVTRDRHPAWLDGHTDDADVARMARGRGIIDFVAGLSDGQALRYATKLGPSSSGLLWASGV